MAAAVSSSLEQCSRGDRPRLPRCAARSGRGDSDCGIEDIRRGRDRAGDRCRPARVRRKSRARGESEMAAAASKSIAGIELHLIGPLQSNKAKEAVALFDAIHSVDRASLCEALAKEIASRRVDRFFSSRSIPAPNRKKRACCRRKPMHSLRLVTRNTDYNFRTDVHSAARRGAGAAFCADGQDREA